MKWTFIIQQKIKVIVLLTSMIVLIGVTNYMEQKNIDQMHESFNSIYYDRLIPATEIFHMTQNLYNQRILMETALRSSPVSPNLDEALRNLTRIRMSGSSPSKKHSWFSTNPTPWLLLNVECTTTKPLKRRS